MPVFLPVQIPWIQRAWSAELRWSCKELDMTQGSLLLLLQNDGYVYKYASISPVSVSAKVHSSFSTHILKDLWRSCAISEIHRVAEQEHTPIKATSLTGSSRSLLKLSTWGSLHYSLHTSIYRFKLFHCKKIVKKGNKK